MGQVLTQDVPRLRQPFCGFFLYIHTVSILFCLHIETRRISPILMYHITVCIRCRDAVRKEQHNRPKTPMHHPYHIHKVQDKPISKTPTGANLLP